MAQTQEQIAENRRRYEELRAAGQELTPKGLPEPTALDGAPIPPEAVVHREAVPSGWYTTLLLRRGEVLRIIECRSTRPSPGVATSRLERVDNPFAKINR